MLTFSREPEIAEQQMSAIIFYLIAFGYIDGDFDLSEKSFIKSYIAGLVEKRADDALPADTDPEIRAEVVGRFVTHFHEVFEAVDRDVRDLFTEVVAKGEKVEQFVYAKLKLRSYEIFQGFDRENQLELLDSVEELINADGKIHPNEARFRDEVKGLLEADIPESIAGIISGIDTELEITDTTTIEPREDNHAFFSRFEEHYSKDPVRIRAQVEADHELIVRTMAELERQREGGAGRLAGHQKVEELKSGGPFLDGHVYVHPVDPDKRYQLVVLGDLHGCYSCLKAALMQADFFAKVEAFRLDPENNPDVKLVLLGDYIDRGKFSYNGVLRTVMQLYLTVPDHVYVLRGNHEFYLEYNGRIYGGVRPAEAINTLMHHMPQEMFEAYMRLFEALPNILLFGKTMFVHAGIPRDADLRDKYTDLSSLNDAELRFQMLWSDPSQADFIPEELQAQNARFPFGKKQFERFMSQLGCTTLVRGHEKVVEGFRSVYPEGAARLLNVFSAGGDTNNDLPEDSSYREVTPMALTMDIAEGSIAVTPWLIDYARYNDPDRNAFFRAPPEIEHKAE
jgi:hypothetical protein